MRSPPRRPPKRHSHWQVAEEALATFGTEVPFRVYCDVLLKTLKARADADPDVLTDFGNQVGRHADHLARQQNPVD